MVSSRAILTIKNTEADNMNNTLMEPKLGDLVSLYSVVSAAEEDSAVLYTPKFLNSLSLSGLPPPRIDMKSGVLIITFRNLNISR